MLRVGLTGGLGSGKSTVAQMFARLGAKVISADEIGRRQMRPGEEMHAAILHHFGDEVLASDGSLDRARLARIAFREGREEELSRIVHPFVVAEQEKWAQEVFAREPQAVAVIESALIFEAERSGTAPGWKQRFDRLVLVTAPEDLKIARFITRSLEPDAGEERRAALEADARARLKAQIPDEKKAPHCDYVIVNAGVPQDIEQTVAGIYADLKAESARRTSSRSMTSGPCIRQSG